MTLHDGNIEAWNAAGTTDHYVILSTRSQYLNLSSTIKVADDADEEFFESTAWLGRSVMLLFA